MGTLSSVHVTTLWDNSRVSGIVDLNEFGQEFNFNQIDKELIDSELIFFPENENDHNLDFDNKILFNYWNLEENMELLLLSSESFTFQQDLFEIAQFNIEGSLPMNLFLQHFPINDEFDALLLSSFLGFLLEDLDTNKTYFGYNLAPENLRDYFMSDLPISFPDQHVSYQISNNLIEISYNNLILYWSEIPPNTSLSLTDNFQVPIPTPLIFHSSISYITIFNNITMSFKLIKTQSESTNRHSLYEIQQYFELGVIELLGVNETLSTSSPWLNSFEIDPHSFLTIDLPFPFPTVDFSFNSPFSIYTENDAKIRINQLIVDNLAFSTLTGVKNYIYPRNNFDGEFLQSSITTSQNEIFNGHNFQNYLNWEYNDTESQRSFAFYRLDTRGQDLFQAGGQLYPVKNTIFSGKHQKALTLDAISYYNSLIEPSQSFLINYSQSLGLPLILPQAIQIDTFDIFVKSYFSSYSTNDGSLIGYFPYMTMLNIDDDEKILENGNIQPTNGFTIFILPFVVTTVLIIRSYRIKNRK